MKTEGSLLRENAKPFMRKVLSCLNSSFLKHSFSLNSILPASFSSLGLSSGLVGGGFLRAFKESGKKSN